MLILTLSEKEVVVCTSAINEKVEDGIDTREYLQTSKLKFLMELVVILSTLPNSQSRAGNQLLGLLKVVSLCTIE